MKTPAKIVFTALISSLVLSPHFAFAKQKNSPIHDRLVRQQQRIDHGVYNGELTRKETKKLRKDQRKIRKLVKKFRSDGILTRAERKKLNNRLNKAGDRIWKFKHNDRRRNPSHSHSYAYQEPRHRWNDHSGDFRRWQRQRYDHRPGHYH